MNTTQQQEAKLIKKWNSVAKGLRIEYYSDDTVVFCYAGFWGRQHKSVCQVQEIAYTKIENFSLQCRFCVYNAQDEQLFRGPLTKSKVAENMQAYFEKEIKTVNNK